MYDEILMKIGGYGRYQRLASLVIISSIALNFAQLWALNLFLL